MSTELLFRHDAYLKTATAQAVAVHERGIELDRSIFYPVGGGQSGDTGFLLRANGERIEIADTRKGDAIDRVLHIPAPGMPRPEIGETLTLEIDWQRRYALMRLHTALHVMSCVVVAPVTGGNISGAATATLTISPTSTGDVAVNYNCVVTNTCSSTSSNNAALTLFPSGGGDGNTDGFVDGADLQGFVNILQSGGQPSAAYCVYDMNADGSVDLLDVDPFVALLLNL